MNIVEQTSNKPTLRNSALGAWILGSLIAFVGICIPLFCAGKTIHILTFNCQIFKVC